MTFTFKLATWSLRAYKQVSLKPIHKVKVLTVTLTFDLATRFLLVTHRLVKMIICAKLFINPTMNDKVMGRTQTGVTEAYAQS